jgi:hypothetical protein
MDRRGREEIGSQDRPLPLANHLMYLLSYMASCVLLLNSSADCFQDRTNIGNAKIAGMSDDLELSSNQYSTALVVFFGTYVFFEAPSNMICHRFRPILPVRVLTA